MRLRVGTRGSPLARTQTASVCRMLEAGRPGLVCETVCVQTTGDRIRDRPLREAGGKGLFVKELDEALLDGRIDCAVHSMKDVPALLADALHIAAVPVREDPRDLLVSAAGWSLADVPEGAHFGTTSLRRAGLLKRSVPGARVSMLRGNVETRARRILDGDFDATFLAAAGIARLQADLAPLCAVPCDPADFVPAPGQGALALVARRGEDDVSAILSAVGDDRVRSAVTAERALAAELGGSCYIPLGAFARPEGDGLVMDAVLVSPDGRREVRRCAHGGTDDAAAFGRGVAEELLALGASELIGDIEREAGLR